jgi:serralysin
MSEMIRVCLDPEQLVQPAGVKERMALVKDARWGSKFNLRIRFLGGEQSIRDKVRQHAEEWRKYADILFTWVEQGDAEVRISFIQNGSSSSAVGRDALKKTDQTTPTMNYGWLYENTPDDDVRQVVLHEFGHALGCIHEHQHPENGIPWDKPKVYAYYWDHHKWDKARVDRNVLNAYDKTLLKATGELDPLSIMLYPVDPALTDNQFSSGWNKTLSEPDKQFIKSMYPR